MKAVVGNSWDSRKWAFDSHLMRLRSDRLKAAIAKSFCQTSMLTGGPQCYFLTRRGVRSSCKSMSTRRNGRPFRDPVTSCARVQTEFIRCTWRCRENAKSAQSASLAELDALFASLQHRAFRGEL